MEKKHDDNDDDDLFKWMMWGGGMNFVNVCSLINAQSGRRTQVWKK